MTPFSTRLATAVYATTTPLCVGIDPHPDRLPGADPADSRQDRARRALAFGRAILAAARGAVPAVKPQFAFFEQLGPAGMQALATLCAEAREIGLVVIGDAKRGDIGTTAAAYAAATLHEDAPFPCDALTVSPFLGLDTLLPFATAAHAGGRGIFVLYRTSNAGSATFQVGAEPAIRGWLNQGDPDAYGLSPLGAVVGVTHVEALQAARVALPRAWLLLPGYGAQGGTARDAAPAFRKDGLGALIVAARSATFPEGPDARWETDPETFIAERIRAIRAEIDAVVQCVAPA